MRVTWSTNIGLIHATLDDEKDAEFVAFLEGQGYQPEVER